MLPIALENPFIIISASCQVTVIVYASEAEEFSQISPLGHTWTDLCGI
jgi:hypothetical protein